MRKPSKRPAMAFDSLEGRIVLSTAISTVASSTIAIAVQDAHQVQQEFNTFKSTYNQDFRTILYGAGADGSINPTANRAAFDAKVVADLTTLNTSIANTVSNLSDGTTLAATIQGEILGTGSTSLQGELAALATPSGAYNASTRLFRADSTSAIQITSNEVTKQVRTDTSTSTTTGTTTNTAEVTAVKAVQTAFNTFQTSYSSDISTILYAAGSDGSINPATNRTTFNTKVATDLATLNTSVTTALSALTSSTTVISQAQAAINGSGANSLQSELTGLTTPSGPYTSSARVFSSASNTATNATLSSILSNVYTTYGSLNTGHGGFGGFGHGGFGGFGGIFGRFFGRR